MHLSPMIKPFVRWRPRRDGKPGLEPNWVYEVWARVFAWEMRRARHPVHREVEMDEARAKIVLVDDSEFRTPAVREQKKENYYGRLLAKYEDGRTYPIICQHGGSMWLCPECARGILKSEE